ncbi:MAG: glycosyltransferase [Pseudomonadota bacterium]
MKILYAGHFKSGNSGRSMKDALARKADVEIDEFDLDNFMPKGRSFRTRLAYKLIRPWQMADLRKLLIDRAQYVKPDAIITTKGSAIDAATVRSLQKDVAPVFNRWPDPSPHAFGPVIKEAVGAYDAVFSTKRHHPGMWRSDYGYSNRCFHVAHGYCADLHLYDTDPDESAQDYDIVSIASGRPEYFKLIKEFHAALGGRKIRVALGGSNWDRYPGGLPEGFENIGERFGRAYTDWLRRGKIVLAPVMTGVKVNGAVKQGDQVTARTYQCAAARVFFIHTRTDEAMELYDEHSEVPMYSDGTELAEKVLHFLDHPDERRSFAKAAFSRGVPAFSHDARAGEILDLMKSVIAGEA